MSDSLDVAKNAIVNAQNQSVRIDSAGIHVGGQGGYQLRMINNMIAMTDDNWQHAKLAIGLFGADGARDNDGNTTNQYWGVNADVIGGKLIVGHNLIIENVNDMGVMQFKVDAAGAFLNNGVLCVQTDTKDKGKLMIDPRYGIAAGNQSLYTIGADGTTLVPSFIDGTGVSLDADGMPNNTMFYLDIRNGKAYFRGDIHADNGYFHGEVHATSGEFTGTLKAAILDGKLVGSENASVDLSDVDYIDLGGMILDGRPGSTGITFRPGYEPVKYQFGIASAGPWHDTMDTNDKYRRDSLDGGTTWGSPYQFRGSDGKNGSDANVNFDNIMSALQKAAGTKDTFITADEMGSPNIYGGKIYGAEVYTNEFNVYPKDGTDDTGSLNLYGKYSPTGKMHHMFRIEHYGGSVGFAPTVTLYSPHGAKLCLLTEGLDTLDINGAVVNFNSKTIDFSQAGSIKWDKNAPVAVFG